MGETCARVCVGKGAAVLQAQKMGVCADERGVKIRRASGTSVTIESDARNLAAS